MAENLKFLEDEDLDKPLVYERRTINRRQDDKQVDVSTLSFSFKDLGVLVSVAIVIGSAFYALNQRLDKQENKLEVESQLLESRINNIEKQLDAVDRKLDNLLNQLTEFLYKKKVNQIAELK